MLLWLGFLCACRSSDDNSIAYIEFYKEYPDFAPKVYQCKWKDEIYYFIPDIGESCYYCNAVFRSDGMMVEWNSKDETIDFVSNSSSWKCIFFL